MHGDWLMHVSYLHSQMYDGDELSDITFLARVGRCGSPGKMSDVSSCMRWIVAVGIGLNNIQQCIISRRYNFIIQPSERLRSEVAVSFDSASIITVCTDSLRSYEVVCSYTLISTYAHQTHNNNGEPRRGAGAVLLDIGM